MTRTVLWALALLVLGPLLWADEPPKDKPDKAAKPAEQYQALVKEYQKAQQDFSKAYSAAKTDEERQKAFTEKYPMPQKYAPRFLKLAQDNLKDPAALDALIWVVTAAGHTPEGGKAIDLLLADYVTSPKLGSVCQALQYGDASAAADRLLREAMVKNPSHEVQGHACFSLAFRLKQHDQAKEAEALFERVVKDCGDIKGYSGTLADAAKGELFEMHHLVIGKTAPEIEGEDIDGKKFKLSDYRGKVVVLDFWGNW
jgi:tetratricopeptide (TPR) repeat protein